MTENLQLWDRFADVDPKFTKAITGKDYGGTSPNPHYVIRCLTEMFGPVGHGFGWRVLVEGFQPFGDTILHWCRIEFWTRQGGEIGTYEAYGQTKAAYPVKGGPEKGGYVKVDEDAPKKSLTDAVVKAASQVGVAANIFLGRWDDSKYVAEVNKEFREAEREEAQAAKQTAAKPEPPRPLADQMGPQPSPQEAAPPLPIATVRRGCLKNIAKAPDLAELQRMEGSALFEGYLNRLQAEDRDGWLEVCAALEERRAALMPPDLDDSIPDFDAPRIPMPNREMAEAVGDIPEAFHG